MFFFIPWVFLKSETKTSRQVNDNLQDFSSETLTLSYLPLESYHF